MMCHDVLKALTQSSYLCPSLMNILAELKLGNMCACRYVEEAEVDDDAEVTVNEIDDQVPLPKSSKQAVTSCQCARQCVLWTTFQSK